MTGGGDEERYERDELAETLSPHLRRRLDPQLGRAAAAFEAAAVALPPRRSSRYAFVAAVAGGLIAAALLLAWPLVARHDSGPRGVAGGAAHVPAPGPTPLATPAQIPDFERVVTWRTVVEGARVVHANVPVRKVRYEAVEQIEWSQPEDQATIRLSVPVSEVLLVQQQTF